MSDELEADIAERQSRRGRANRRRGGDAERLVALYLRQNGFPDARRYLAGDGRQPGDLDWHPCVVAEVKDVASSSWPKWQRQAMEACKPGQAPLVVRRWRGVPDPGRWTCRVHVPSWLTVVRGEDVVFETSDEWWPMTFAMAVADVRAMDEEAA